MFRFAPNSGFFWLHDLFWLLIVIALVAGAFLLVRAVLHRPLPPRPPYMPAPGGPPFMHGPGAPAQSALAELDLRYARGDIDRDEYLQRRADLTGQVPPGPSPAPG
ncbi:MAG TPA: SHOCT domain-containing protein [Candidatus Dormibacteraeota bacterium]